MSRPKKDVSSYPTHAQVRQATGLTADEKLLLHTIASHENEVSWGSRQTLKRWTGLSERRFRQAREGALSKGVLVHTPRAGGATTYRIGKAALKRMANEGTRLVSNEASRSASPKPGTAPDAEAVTTAVNPPDHREHGHHDHSELPSPDHSGLPKKNKKPNTEDIKNMKSSRRIRPTRTPTRTTRTEPGTMDEQKASLHQRLRARKENA